MRLLLLGGRVVASSITGANVDAELAACIDRGVEHLQVPPHASPVVVNYPFRSEPPRARATAAALHADVEARLDAIVGPVDPVALDAEALARATRP